MTVSEFIESINTQNPTPFQKMEYINNHPLNRYKISIETAKKICESEFLNYEKIKDESNLIDNLIYNTNIGNKTIIFLSFKPRVEVDSDFFIFCKFNDDILISYNREGEIFANLNLEFSGNIVKAFPTTDAFLKSVVFLNKLFCEKLYKKVSIKDTDFNLLFQLCNNDIECKPFLEILFRQIQSFE